MSRTHIITSSNKIRASFFAPTIEQRRCFLAISIAEDILKELENPCYKRKYKDEYIVYKNSIDPELKHGICRAVNIIYNRNIGYKPIFKDTIMVFYKKLLKIIPA
jgi:hypothetical protein